MLKKMLHYDFKAILKFWWIGLLSTLVLAVGAGFCGSLLLSEKTLPVFINIMSIFVVVIAFISLFAFALLTNILIYIRYYKNLFTDEGYLTFTLPLKRSQVLNSKLISGLVISVSTAFAVMLEMIIGCCIAFHTEIFTPDFYNDVMNELIIFEDAEIAMLVIFLIQTVIISVLASAASLLFTFMCIAIGSVITRKNKIATAIGIYYVSTAVLTFVIQIFFLFGIGGMVNWIENIPDNVGDWFAIGALMVVIFFVGTIATILYAINYWLLDKKLNLS